MRPPRTSLRGLVRIPAQSRTYALVTGSQIVQLGSAFVLTLMLARSLGPAEFGAFAFVIAALGVAGSFSELGFFSATARLMAKQDDEEATRRLVGGATALAVIIFVAFDLVVVALAFLVEPVFGVDAKVPMLVAAPLAGGIALDLVVLFLCQGTGRNELIVLNNLVSRPLPLVVLGAISLVAPLSLSVVCVVYVAGPTVAAVLVLRALRPDFTNLRESTRSIKAELKTAGDFGIYISRAIGTSTYNLDRILVAFFLNATQVSYYALAFSLVTPVTLGSQSLGWISYKRFARETRIAPRLFAANAAWLVTSACAVCVVILVVVNTVLSDYKPVESILLPALATAMMMGALQLPNWFLMAQGRGRTLRDLNLTFAAVNIALNFTLIPIAGIKGAAYASMVAAMTSLGLHLVRYRAFLAGSRGGGIAAHPEAAAN
jgi:O-antigen/teichoic acid export membrane protein